MAGPKITVVNKHHGATGVYIGRGSPLGNPYPIDNDTGMTRLVVINRYRVWLADKIKAQDDVVCDALNDIAEKALSPDGVKLQCFCAPRACHGDVIKEVIEKALKGVK